MHDDRAIALDIVLACRRIARFIADSSESSFLNDEQKQWAIVSQFTLIGEAAGRLSQDFRESYSTIPWQKVIGMRNRVVHGYDKIDWHLVWATAQRDIPQLLAELESVVQFLNELD